MNQDLVRNQRLDRVMDFGIKVFILAGLVWVIIPSFCKMIAEAVTK